MAAPPVKRDRSGPAMAALNEHQRLFVLALFETEGDRTKAYRAAGYEAADGNSIYSAASRLAHSPKVSAAILECAKSTSTVLVPEMLSLVARTARDPHHRDALRAALALMTRGGLHDIVETKATVDVVVAVRDDWQATVSLMKARGAPQAEIDELLANLPPAERAEIIEAEYIELPEEEVY